MISLKFIDYTEIFQYTVIKERGERMLETVVSWGAAISLLLWVLYTVYFLVVRALSWRCRRQKGYKATTACHERGCRYAQHCGNYVHCCSEEELEKLRRMVDEMARE